MLGALAILLIAGDPGPARFAPVGIGSCSWTDGFWGQRMVLCRESMLPAMSVIMEGRDRSHFLRNFQIAAGLEVGKHRGAPWNDGDTYKWIEALARAYAQTRDGALLARLNPAIADIARAQRPDGYIHTPVLIANRQGDKSASPFKDRLDFEMYNFGHLFTAACVHRQATGSGEFLKVAVRAADHLDRAFANTDGGLAGNNICPSHYMGILDLYRLTGEKRYLALARRWMALRESATGGTDDNQDRVPFRLQTEAVGHAVRANYLYAGAADLYLETGDKSLLEPLEAVWRSAANRKTYVTGGCGALFDGASPDGSKDQKTITRIHQAYGRNYQLPNSTAHNESCAAVGSVLWNWRMLRATGLARHGDMIETALHNAVLASASLDGRRFFYTNTLRQLDTMPAMLRWSRRREEWISCYCCPPNVARLLCGISDMAYGLGGDSVWLNLYGASRLDTELSSGGRLALRQETGYPWDGKVRVVVEAAPGRPITILARIPGWARGARATARGETRDALPGTYHEFKGGWKAGDVLELDFPMEPRLVEAHPLVEEARNQVAVARGPVVYCLESHDLPKGCRLSGVSIPQDARFTPRKDDGLVRGMIRLECRASHRKEAAWNDQLYRDRQPAAPDPIQVSLIPYFAWENRGPSEMSVWLPLGP